MRKVYVAVAVLVAVLAGSLIFVWWSSSQTGSYATINAIVHYTDGTIEEVKSNSISRLDVSFEGKPIDYVQFDLYGSFTYEGTIDSLYRDATIEFDFDRDGTAEDSKTEKSDLHSSLIPTSGASFRLVYLQVTATEIENWATISGQHTSTVRGTASIDVTFSDGQTSHLESDGYVTANFVFTIDESGVTSALSISITPRPWKSPPPKI